MRSRTGCKTCRQRKLKCDEARPVCGQCTKASRECIPSEGVTFRHQQNASMNGTAADHSGLDKFFKYTDTFHRDHVWLDIPREISFFHITDPYTQLEPAADSTTSRSTPIRNRPVPHGAHNRLWSQNKQPLHSPSFRLDTLSSVAANDPYILSSPLESQGRSYLASPGSVDYITSPDSRPTTGHTPMTLDTPMTISANQTPHGPRTPIDPSLLSPQNGRTNSPRVVEPAHAAIEDEHERAFLLRHYAEVPGRGMDLFDCGRYFSYHVPTKVWEDPLLQAAACAYAAKQLAKSGGAKTPKGPHITHALARMETWPDATGVNWEYIHEKYYGEAIGLLTQALNDIRLWPESRSSSGGGPTAANKPPSLSDELMAATAILCEYEAMDAAMSASGVWQSHLAGAKSLLDIAEAGMYARDGPDTSDAPKFAGARKAIFWNFARQDFAAANITDCQTRLDIHNYAMWRAAGLDLDNEGRILPSTDFSHSTPSDNHSREDMLANALIFLLSRLNNYIVSGGSMNPAGPAHQGPRYEDIMSGVDHLGISQQTLLEHWKRISQDFDTWHDSLPKSFLPVKKIPHPVFSEIWHSIPMCASAMQAYHMAKILLLSNRPHETTARRTTVFAKLKSYRAIPKEAVRHAREICGIALARHECSVRIFSIQPLFVAGSAFEERAEQEVVYNLLEGIERELGWKTDYRRRALLEDWGWDREGSEDSEDTPISA